MEGFTDISDTLGIGIYVLLRQGRVVFVGKSVRGMLSKLATHRSPDGIRVLPAMKFDQVFVRRVHPDRLESEYASLLAIHQPEYNFPRAVPSQFMERRV